MLILIKMELFKFFHNKKNLALLLIGVLLVFGFALDFMKKNEEYISGQMEYYRVESILAFSQYWELEQQEGTFAEQQSEAKKEEYAFWKKEMETVSKLRGLYHYYNTEYGTQSNIARTLIERNQNLMEGLEKGYQGMKFKSRSAQEEIKELKKENEVLSALLYMYEDQLKEDPDMKFMYQSPYEMNGLNFLATVFDEGRFLLVAFLLLFLLMDMYAGEIETGSYKLLFTAPFSRKKILLSKCLAGIIASLLSILLMIAIVFLCMCLLNGLGNIRYPYYVENSVLSCGVYLQQLSMLSFAFLIFLVVAYMTLSVFVRASSTLALLAAGTLLVTYFLYESYGFDFKPLTLLPFFSLYVSDVIQGKGLLSVYGCMGSLLFLSICLLLGASGYIAKADLKDGE